MSKTGGYLDCRKLIYEGRCTIVAEFLRRVQEVIWNRKLMRTKGGRLGLVQDDVSPGFKVCILYGCSVPVILEEKPKTKAELKAELIDRYNQWYDRVRVVVAFCELRYKLVKAKREQKEMSQNLGKGFTNAGGLVRRQGKGTWPLNRGELVESKKLTAPLEKGKLSLKDIPEGSGTRAEVSSSSRPTGPPTIDNNLPPGVTLNLNLLGQVDRYMERRTGPLLCTTALAEKTAAFRIRRRSSNMRIWILTMMPRNPNCWDPKPREKERRTCIWQEAFRSP